MTRVPLFVNTDETLFDRGVVACLNYWRRLSEQKINRRNDAVELYQIDKINSDGSIEYRVEDEQTQHKESVVALAQQLFDEGVRTIAVVTSSMLDRLYEWAIDRYHETMNIPHANEMNLNVFESNNTFNIINISATASRFRHQMLINMVPNSVSLLRLRPMFRHMACGLKPGDLTVVVTDESPLNDDILDRFQHIMCVDCIFKRGEEHKIKKLKNVKNVVLLTFDGSFLDSTYPHDAKYIAFDTLLDEELNPDIPFKITNIDVVPALEDPNVKQAVMTQNYMNTIFYKFMKMAATMNIKNINAAEGEQTMKIDTQITSIHTSYGTNIVVPAYHYYYYQQGIWYRPNEDELFGEFFDVIREKAKKNNIHPMYVWYLYKTVFLIEFGLQSQAPIEEQSDDDRYNLQDIYDFIDNTYAYKDFDKKEQLKKTVKDIGNFNDYVRFDSHFNDSNMWLSTTY